MKRHASRYAPKAKIHIHTPSTSSDEQWRNSQDHARTRTKSIMSPITSDSSTSVLSLSSSISKFRIDFDELKCKMKLFGESLNLCRCIASDFKNKLEVMERRLENLEKKQRIERSESNYSAIIQKNRILSSKTLQDAKKLQMCGTEEEMRDVAARICRNYLHGAWKSVEPSQLDFKRISGGLSNFLYYVALPDDTTHIGKFTQRESSPEDDETSITKIIKKDLNRCNSYTVEEPKKVLLRIYGQVHGERAMDAIVTESVIFTLLSERRLGPKLHGVFSGGRIEEYIPARPLLTKELGEPAMSMKIAEKMAAIHSMDVPLSKEPNWLWKTMGKWYKTVREERLSGNTTGRTNEEEKIIKRLKVIDFDKEIEWLKKFIATVESPVVFCHNDMQEGNILILEDVIQISDDEVSTVYVQTYDTDSPKSNKENNHTRDNSMNPQDGGIIENIDIGTADISTTNISSSNITASTYEDANTSDSILSHISDSGEPRLVLIDFEYCAYNYRGFDIANHFQEWVYDYTNPAHPFYFENQEHCPTLEQKPLYVPGLGTGLTSTMRWYEPYSHTWAQCGLLERCMKGYQPNCQAKITRCFEIFIKEYLKHYSTNLSESREATPSIDDVNHLLNEVDAFALASHLFWCLWSIVNASKSQIPFGYWEYAVSRLETYLRLKQEVVKKDKFGFPQKRKIEEVDI